MWRSCWEWSRKARRRGCTEIAGGTVALTARRQCCTLLTVPRTSHRLTSLTRLVRQSASLLQPEGNCPDDLLFVFVDNLDSMPLLKRSLVKKGCRFVHLGQKLIGWTWAFKIEAVLWFLQRSKVTNDTYIISSDAGDSALVSIMDSRFCRFFPLLVVTFFISSFEKCTQCFNLQRIPTLVLLV